MHAPATSASLPDSLGLRSFADNWLATTDSRRACLLGLFCAALFVLVNWRNFHQDVVPLAFAPVSVWRHGTVSVDAFRPYLETIPEQDRWAWTESDSNGHLYSRKSVFVSLLAAPFYLPPVLAGIPDQEYRVWIAWGRLVAALLSGLTVALCYLTLRRWGEVLPATLLSLLLAFGTCVWTIIGQTLYDHQAILFVALVAWLLHDFPLSPGRAFLAALAAGAAVALRPTTVVLLFPVGVFLLLPGRLAGWRGYLAAVAGILVFPLWMALANSLMFGHWAATGYPPGEYRDNWRNFWPEGAAGLLLAPNSGLFIQSPWTLLALVGGWVVWLSSEKVRDGALLRVYTLTFLVYWALFALWHDWQGGLTFSTRMLSEGYPLWMPLVLVGWNWISRYRWALGPVLVAGLCSVAYHLANLAIFDAVTPLNPVHRPWSPADHYFPLHVRAFGAWATIQAVLVTVGWFALWSGFLLLVLRPFILPKPGPTVTEDRSAPALQDAGQARAVSEQV
jgi:hypothetical protein